MFSVVGRATSAALAVVALGFTTRALGTGVFGEYSLVLVLLYIFSVFGSFGLDPLLTREISKPGADEQATLERIFFTRFLLLCVFLALGTTVVFFLPWTAGVKFGVLSASLGSLCFSLAQLLTGVFQKYLRTEIPALVEVAVRGAQVALSWYFWRAGFGLFSFLFIFAMGGVIQLVCVYAWVSMKTKFRFRMRSHGFWDVVHKGWPLAASALLTLIYFRGNTIMISFMHSSSDVGIWSLAYKVLEQAIFIPIAFAGLVMPLLSRYATTDPTRFRGVFQRAFDFLAIIALPFSIGGVWVSSDIVRLLAGSGFESATLPLQFLFVALAFIFATALFGNALLAVNRQRELLRVYGAAACVNVALNLYFVWRYSFVGAALSTALTEGLVCTLMLILLWRSERVVPALGTAAKALVASAGMCVLLLALPAANLFVLVCAGAAAYLTLLYLLGGVTKEDVLVFFRRENVISA